MRKFLSMVIVLSLLFSLCDCNGNKSELNDEESDILTESAVTTTSDEDNVEEEETTNAEATIPNNGEWDEILCSGDDYYLVNKYIDTFDEYKLLLGVVNSKGEWVQELTEDGAFVDMVIFRALGSSKILSDSSCFMYLGEGVFLASPGVTVVTPDGETRVGPWENTISTTFTGDETVSVWECLTWNVVDNIQKNFDATKISVYQNGWLFFCEEEPWFSVGILSAMNVKGEITKLPCKNRHGSFPIYSEGLFFAIDKNYDYAFYDIEGNKVIDLSKYDLHFNSYERITGKSSPYFENGTVTILTTNQGGSIYKVVLDKTGEFIGDPEKLY